MLQIVFLVTLATFSAARADELDSNEIKFKEELQRLKFSFFCSPCMKLVEKVKEFIIPDTTQDTIKRLFSIACDQLPLFKSACKSLLEKHVTKIAGIIKTADAKTVCTKIHACKSVRTSSLLHPIERIDNL